MGEISEAMLEGKLCEWCGVYLEPNETAYVSSFDQKIKMPEDGNGFGVPVICKSCFLSQKKKK